MQRDERSARPRSVVTNRDWRFGPVHHLPDGVPMTGGGAAMSRSRARVEGQTLRCCWCGTDFELAATGRIPKWCSQACRQRAWEQHRAAASGLSAVEVVVQPVQVEKQVVVDRPVEVCVAPRGAAWRVALRELAAQLDRSPVYNRDLPGLEESLDEVLRALGRRLSALPARRRPR